MESQEKYPVELQIPVTAKCPFCDSDIGLVNQFEFPCPVCLQLVGVMSDGSTPRLVRAAPDSRKPWIYSIGSRIHPAS